MSNWAESSRVYTARDNVGEDGNEGMSRGRHAHPHKQRPPDGVVSP
jgi:hypothetical protein